MKTIGISFLLIFCITSSYGLTCWTCENARSNQDCMNKGTFKNCTSNENVCENVIRRGNYRMYVTKNCKQSQACKNNYNQNLGTAWFPTQCNIKSPSSVCRCCCGTNMCNKDNLGCKSGCATSGPIDVVFALDSSSSIGRRNWTSLQNFVSRIINKFTVGENAARIGAYQFTYKVDEDTQILLNSYSENKTAILEALQKISYIGGGTYAGTALKHARDTMFNVANGDRTSAPNVLVVITDGRFYRDELVKEQLRLLRTDGVDIIAVQIGKFQISVCEEFFGINAIARNKTDVVEIDSLTAGPLDKYLAKIEKRIC